MKIRVFSSEDKSLWDDFISKSKNGVFLFYRDYVEYHQDRFQDFSLLIFDHEDQLIALLPANCDGKTLISHGGLSFGGLISAPNTKTGTLLSAFGNLMSFLKDYGFNEIIYKTVPAIYHKYPAEEDRYALFLANAQIVGRSIFTIVKPKANLPMQERRRRAIKKARNAQLTIELANDVTDYWLLLTNLLKEKHNTQPVHTRAEISYLKSRFPNNIKLYAAYSQKEMVAGILIYENDTVARAQYIAANDQGRTLGALDLLFDYLINDIYLNKDYFDFSSSDLQLGKELNLGLLEQKEGFGGRSITFDLYSIDLTNWHQEKYMETLS